MRKRMWTYGLTVVLMCAPAIAQTGQSTNPSQDPQAGQSTNPSQDPMSQGPNQGQPSTGQELPQSDMGRPSGMHDMHSMKKLDRAQVMQMIADWPQKPKMEAESVIQKYGPPNEATPSMLVWHNNGPWKKSVLSREETPHNFPMPHTDFFKQTIAYDIDADKVDELTKFDGSVYVDRTQGELSARCDKEMFNILAINLADEVIKGKRNVDEARKTYAEEAMKAKQNNPSKWVQALQFQPDRGMAADPDKAANMDAKMGMPQKQ